MAEFAAVLTAYLAATGPATAEMPARPREKEPPPPRPRRRRRSRGDLSGWAWAGIVAGAATMAILVGVGLVMLLRPGLGEVRVELSEPSARVEVRVDGEPVTGDLENLTLQLRPGQHTLEVTGDGYRPVRMEFPVKRGDNPALVVKLESIPRASHAPGAGGAAKPEDGDRAAPPPPTGPLELVWRSRENLRAGKIEPPAELSKARLWFTDNFKDPGSGFGAGKPKGYRNNLYFIRPLARARHFSRVPLDRAKPPDPTGPFAVEASGRVTGVSGRWGVAIGDAEAPLLAIVSVSDQGQVLLSGDVTSDVLRRVEPVPGKHPAVKREAGAGNRLTVVVAGRYLEVYVNKAAVCDPVLLPRELKGTPRICLACMSSNDEGGTLAEFEGINVAPANLPPLTERGAVPKPR
jgi:hypothetical protein